MALSAGKISCSISSITQNPNSFSFTFRNVRDQHVQKSHYTDEENEITWGWFTQDYPLSQMQSLYLNPGLLTASFPHSPSHNPMVFPLPTVLWPSQTEGLAQDEFSSTHRVHSFLCVGCFRMAIISSFLSCRFDTCPSYCPIHSHIQFWDSENTAFPVLFYMIRF